MTVHAQTHHLVASAETTHTGYFDAGTPPVLRIRSGDTVVLDTLMLLDGQVRFGMTLEELLAARQSYVERRVGPHTLTGPIFVEGAEPGDVLEVGIQRLRTIDWGVNYHLPGRLGAGALPEDFPGGRLRTIRLDLARMEAEVCRGVVVPLRPFLGIMGVAPKAGERRGSAAPDYFGGNLDCKELVAGTRLYLPVSVPGALFSTGDAHAAQGDGEVNVTAIETAMEEAVLQLTVRKDMALERPLGETDTHWIAMGFHPDLDEAVKVALREALRFMATTRGLVPEDAYAVASLAVDLRVTQVVDGHKGIHAMIPKAVFRDQPVAGR
jgi:acetamidase/formamidase